VTPDFNPWANNENILSFTPLSSLSSIIHQLSPCPNRVDHLLSLLPPLSKLMEI
jgi:hypothetical protein